MLIQALLLLLVANGTPVIASFLLRSRFAWPLDGGRKAWDEAPWLGQSKTLRGVSLSLLITVVAAVLIGLPWTLGLLFSALAMAGDLLSSFCKRRLGLKSSSKAPGLDQIPESLLPLWVCQTELGLGWQDVLLLVAIFWVVELLLSRLLFRLHIRNRPY